MYILWCRTRVRMLGSDWSIFWTTIGCVRALGIVMTSQHHILFMKWHHKHSMAFSLSILMHVAIQWNHNSHLCLCSGICKITQHIKVSLAWDGFEPQTLWSLVKHFVSELVLTLQMLCRLKSYLYHKPNKASSKVCAWTVLIFLVTIHCPVAY